jgi:hypothetical protein
MASVQSSHYASWPYGWLDRPGDGEQHVALGRLSSRSCSVPSNTDLADVVLLMLEDGSNGLPEGVARGGQVNHRTHPAAFGRG